MRRAWMTLGLMLGGAGCGPQVQLEFDEAEDSGTDEGQSEGSLDGPGPGDDSGTTGADGGSPPSSTTAPFTGCGDGELGPGEECDGAELQGASCGDFGHPPGTLACSAMCTYDLSGCIPAGMVHVPGGPFEMGSDDLDSNGPVRIVTVDAFYIDQTEVTAEAYAACVAAGACGVPAVGNYFNYGVPGRERHPVNGVTWYDAEAYCGWVDGGVKRLPTEAEWEKAARGTDGRTYPWGDAPEASCTHVIMDDGISHGCGLNSTDEVGSRPLGVSPYDAYDMSGNVYEWVQDYWDFYDPADVDNPTGPAAGDMRVARGGAWGLDNPFYLTTTYRGGDFPYQQYMIIGFRCARPAP